MDCAPESGTFFGIGFTTVNCTASDGASNQSSDTATIAILNHRQQWAALKKDIAGSDISRLARLQLSRNMFAADLMARFNSTRGMRTTLTTLDTTIRMTGLRLIPADLAREWPSDVNDLRQTLGCR